MTQLNRLILSGFLALALLAAGPAAVRAQESDKDTYSENEILTTAKGFFGEITEGLDKAIEHVFED